MVSKIDEERKIRCNDDGKQTRRMKSDRKEQMKDVYSSPAPPSSSLFSALSAEDDQQTDRVSYSCVGHDIPESCMSDVQRVRLSRSNCMMRVESL